MIAMPFDLILQMGGFIVFSAGILIGFVFGRAVK